VHCDSGVVPDYAEISDFLWSVHYAEALTSSGAYPSKQLWLQFFLQRKWI
jgi:hypothetical protein